MMSLQSHGTSKMCSMPTIKRNLRQVQHFHVKVTGRMIFRVSYWLCGGLEMHVSSHQLSWLNIHLKKFKILHTGLNFHDHQIMNWEQDQDLHVAYFLMDHNLPAFRRDRINTGKKFLNIGTFWEIYSYFLAENWTRRSTHTLISVR